MKKYKHLLEKALSIYLEHLNKIVYIKSFKQMAKDTDVLSTAEEGMEDYFAQIKNIS